MTVDTRSSFNQSTHKMTEEGWNEVKGFVKKIILLLIVQFILNIMIDNGTIPNDPWIEFLVSIIVGVFIALNIIKWVNMEISFFEQTEWYKAQVEKQQSNPQMNEYEFTEEGKEATRMLIKRIVYLSLFMYLMIKITSFNVVEIDLGIIGGIFPLVIIYAIISFARTKDKIVKRGSRYSSSTDQEYSQTTSNAQPVDIFGSTGNISKQQSDKYAPQTRSDNIFGSNVNTNKQTSNTNRPQKRLKEESKPLFSSKVTSNKNYCKKCYGGLNEQGKCNQCDQKW